MKRINILYIALFALFTVSCDTYLDETPDNRAEVDSQLKIRKLLVSAYTEGGHALVTELSSDNIIDMGTSIQILRAFMSSLLIGKVLLKPIMMIRSKYGRVPTVQLPIQTRLWLP